MLGRRIRLWLGWGRNLKRFTLQITTPQPLLEKEGSTQNRMRTKAPPFQGGVGGGYSRIRLNIFPQILTTIPPQNFPKKFCRILTGANLVSALSFFLPA